MAQPVPAATQAMKSYAHDAGEFMDQIKPNDPKRTLITTAQRGMNSALQLFAGQHQAALAAAAAAIAEVEGVKLAENDKVGLNIWVSSLRAYLGDAAEAAIRLGRYAQAEALAGRALKLPRAPFDEEDPRVATSSFGAVLAHAVALQGRNDEAIKILQPALAYYREQQQVGAHGTNFRRDFAYALYVSAIAAPADAAGRKQRKADLDEAAKQIAGASAEAQKLADLRYVSDLIAATARGE